MSNKFTLGQVVDLIAPVRGCILGATRSKLSSDIVW